MKFILEKDDGSKEEIKHFIVVACPIDHPPFMGTIISNIDEFYISYILSDHGRWEFEKRLK